MNSQPQAKRVLLIVIYGPKDLRSEDSMVVCIYLNGCEPFLITWKNETGPNTKFKC